ncbi:DCR2 [Candida oxycetoniae]|uniref:DCR2 n=1 Tax=Candida oxycetoniae TaxID=497107 RepID=A0AAI9SSG1_9ASCO|nr:DCR2 [Candida oxycetoniae]KAI3402365.2 DCR2 [Candida oxycetoniae]
MLTKRLFRVVSYFLFILFTVSVLLLFANKHEIIELNKYVPFDYFSSAAPAFFQPPPNSFLLDIAIKNCYAYNYNNANCGKPDANSGKYGDLSDSNGGWIRLKKDLSLGKSWFKKQMLSVKKLDSTQFQNLLRDKLVEDSVIIDFAVYDSIDDSKIKGNSLKLPLKIIESFNGIQSSNDDSNLIAPEEEEEQTEKHNAQTEEERIEEERQREEIKEKQEKEEKEQKEKAEEAKKLLESEQEFSKEKQVEEGENSNIEKRSEMEAKESLEKTNLYIPTMKEVSERGWTYKSNGIWTRYGSHNKETAINAVDILFGYEATELRPNWKLLKKKINGISSESDLPAYLSFRRGPKLDYKKKYYTPLKMNKDDQFKILQVADLHFSTGYGKCLDPVPTESAKGCKADSRTLKFINEVLDIEKPDMVVLTGDQIFGETSPDSESSVFKALSPYVKRKIPFAIVMGNHDAEGSMKAKDMMGLYSDLPYSLAAMGPEEIDGYGNYIITVPGKSSDSVALSFYFVDSHSYSSNPKAYPGYDWIKESQLVYMKEEAASLKEGIRKFEKETVTDGSKTITKKSLSMAFFHIPLPEYKNIKQPMVGEHLEAVISPRYNSGARSVFQEIGVKAISVGHDHCNDYCLLDQKDADTAGDNDGNRIWLCYGGGVGLGGYGGYGGYVRRLRIYSFDTARGEIKTWKRAENEPGKKIDEQILASDGEVVNS